MYLNLFNLKSHDLNFLFILTQLEKIGCLMVGAAHILQGDFRLLMFCRIVMLHL